MDYFIKYVVEQLGVIAQAPVPFVAALLVIGALIYAGVRRRAPSCIRVRQRSN